MSDLAERVLIDLLLATLRELPGVSTDIVVRGRVGRHGDHGYDAAIELRIAGEPLMLQLELKKSVFPRDVRQAIWRFRAAGGTPSSDHSAPSLPLLVAETISPGAKDLLRSERVGYFDSGGSLYLPAPGAYLYIDRPPPKVELRSVRALYTGRRAQVVHALLMQGKDWFGVHALARKALVSPATASQVLTELERHDWLDTRGQGPAKQRQLREPAALLDAWAAQLPRLRPQPLRRYYVPRIKADALAMRLGQVFDAHDVAYAISHEAAAQRYAPFLSHVAQVRARVLIGLNGDAAIAELGARVVNEGANLVVIEAGSPGELLFRERLDGLWVASSIQIYLDLLVGEGRSNDMAEHFRKERIGF